MPGGADQKIAATIGAFFIALRTRENINVLGARVRVARDGRAGFIAQQSGMRAVGSVAPREWKDFDARTEFLPRQVLVTRGTSVEGSKHRSFLHWTLEGFLWSDSIQYGSDLRGGSRPAYDAALRANHFERDAFEFGEVAFSGVLHQQAFVAAIVGFAHGGLHADFGGDAADDEMRDFHTTENAVEIGAVEGAFAGLGKNNFAGSGLQFGDEIVAGFAQNQNAAHGATIADGEFTAAAREFGRRAVGEIGTVSFLCVDDRQLGAAKGFEQFFDSGDDFLKR